MQKLHPRAVWMFFFQSVIASLGFIVFISFYAFFAFIVSTVKSGVIQGYYLILPMLIFILSVIFSYFWSQLKYSTWGYELTEDAIRIEKGIIVKKYISIPYERVQNIDIYRGISARIFSLSDLQIQTAGYSGGYGRYGKGSSEGELPGLDIQVAEQLRNELIAKIKGTKQGL
jgi:uncharacterized membrane protein YdbT with pleckstrin-like domain